MFKQCAAAFLAASTLLFSACGAPNEKPAATAAENAAFATITDDNGRTVTFAEKPQRVVVTSASYLAPFYAVGGEVVGRPTTKAKVLAEAASAAEIGPVYQIDMEKVISLKPDLVMIIKGINEKLIDTLDANGIKSIVVDMKSYDDVKRTLTTFAALTGQPEKGAELIAKMDADIEDVKNSIPHEKKRITIIHSTGQGLSVQLDGSIAGSIAKMLGWENTASGMTALDKNPDAAPYSMEALVAQNPDIIFVTSMGEEAEIRASMEAMFNESPAWQSVAAVRENKVYYLPQALFLFSPGIDFPAAVRYMAHLVYP